MMARNRNELWGRVLMDELARAGVRQVVLAPGSRSAPLVLAASSDARLETRVLIDERCCGFLALGVAKATGVPAAVVTTSGTAVANLLPAVIEAAQSEVPLIVLTADRPPRLRGADANQTIDQVGIFGRYARFFAETSPADVSEVSLRHLRSLVSRALAAALGEPAGPVHLNIAFDVPLEPTLVPGDIPETLAGSGSAGFGGRPDGVPWTRVHRSRAAPPSEQVVAEVADLVRGARRPVMIGGVVPRPWERGPALRRAATALGIPLLADALSGARFPCGGGAQDDAVPQEGALQEGALIVGAYDIALRDARVAQRLRPDLVIRTGAAPTSAVLAEWLRGLDGVPYVLVDPGGRWKDHAGSATLAIPSDPGSFFDAIAALGARASCEVDWLAAWRRVADPVAVAVSGPAMEPPFEGTLVSELGRRVSDSDLLFVSGSLPVRDLDAFLPRRDAPLRVLGNRGASGIDGIVSTAAGASLGAGRRVVAIVGDLALLHDSNGLAALRDPGVRVSLVVVNNDGGGIFQFLPFREHEPPFTTHFVAPHGRDLSHLATFHDLPFRRVETGDAASRGPKESRGVSGLRRGLDWILEETGSAILEVRTDREDNWRRRTEAVAAIARAAGDALTGEDG